MRIGFTAQQINEAITIQSTTVNVLSIFGWIVIQQRVDLTTSWDKAWSYYRDGFGSLGSNYWLGLSYVYQLTSAANYRLRIELQDQSTNNWYSVEYGTFSVGDETNSNFQLTVGTDVSGDLAAVGDPLLASHSASQVNMYHSGMMFTTSDSDNDNNVLIGCCQLLGPCNCAACRNGGWWFNNCYYFCPTCYSSYNDVGGVFRYKATRMLIKHQ
jgi:Fibrinogen beta and gamma chains, C-terminal globular domain